MRIATEGTRDLHLVLIWVSVNLVSVTDIQAIAIPRQEYVVIASTTPLEIFVTNVRRDLSAMRLVELQAIASIFQVMEAPPLPDRAADRPIDRLADIQYPVRDKVRYDS